MESPRIGTRSNARPAAKNAMRLDVRPNKETLAFMAEKPRVQRRAASAARLEKLTKGVVDSLAEIPSYTGKARFMDKVIKVQHIAHNLAWDLKRDEEESREPLSE